MQSPEDTANTIRGSSEDNVNAKAREDVAIPNSTAAFLNALPNVTFDMILLFRF